MDCKRKSRRQLSVVFSVTGVSGVRNVAATTTINIAAVAAPMNGAIGATWPYKNPQAGGHIVRAQLPADCA